jgi:hypothetical protein
MRPDHLGENLRVDRAKAYSGNMSLSAKMRLRKSFENLLEIAELKHVTVYRRKKGSAKDSPTYPIQLRFKLNFITLTLPASQGSISDREILVEMLQPFLRSLRAKCPQVSYIWKAEVQKNGNLHFHITTDKYIDLSWIRSNWNSQCRKLGLLQAFASKFGHSDPNSTDVRSVVNDQEIGAYMAKYISKDESDKRSLGIKVWDCSRNLKFKEIRNSPIDNEIAVWLDKLRADSGSKILQCDHCTVIQLDKPISFKDMPTQLQIEYRRYISILKDTTCDSIGLWRNYLESISPPKRDLLRGDRDIADEIVQKRRKIVRPVQSGLVDKWGTLHAKEFRL